MNIVVLQGNLATDVRLRTTTTGKEVASFKLAVNRPGKDADADFVWVKVWNGSAVACEKYLAKGSPVLVDGSIRTSRIADGDGFKEYVEVNARQVTFLSKGNGNGNGASGEPEVTVTVETATPDPEAHAKAVEEARAALAALEAANAAEGEQEAVPATVVEDDDIPF